jgi:hypothetical protein
VHGRHDPPVGYREEGVRVNRLRAVGWAGGLVMALAVAAPRAQERPAGDAIVLLTLDGARHEEIFGGLDVEVLRSTLRENQRLEEAPVYQRFWAPTADERRRKLLPFFWKLVTEQGSVAGNPALGSEVRLSNQKRFSYPGYAEILVGRAMDDVITSNDAVRNPEETVLERLRAELKLTREQVATFASWDVFNAIAEHTEGATTVNAGYEPLAIPGEEVALLNTLQDDARAPWNDARLDVFTFRLAMAYLRQARPRVLYLAFNDTDSWAHEGRYDRTLQAYARADQQLEQLWTWLQAQPDYRGRTHLLITTDHGRGGAAGGGWRHHGEKYPAADRVWMAFVSPKMAQRGEWRGGPPLSTNQVAATLASWVGVDWTAGRPRAGKPIR